MIRCRLECLSTRKVILPPLISLIALVTSMVTVPVFGLGMRPRGPRIRAIRPILAIWSGVAIAASKSSQPPWMRATSSSVPTSSAPAAAHGDLDRGVELDVGGLLGQLHGLGGGVELRPVDDVGGLAVALAALHC